jgi:putative peptidoglycan lipid II flippase
MTPFSRSAITVTRFTALGIALGFASQLVVAAFFGTRPEMDAYFAATTLPALLAAVLAGAVSATFLPLYSEYLEQKPGEARRIAATFLHLAVAAAALLGAGGFLFAEPITRALAPGLPEAQARLSAELLRWLMPGLALTAFNESATALHYARGNFRGPMLIRVIAPLSTAACVFAFSSPLGVRSLALASLSASALQAGILASGLLRKGFMYPRPYGVSHPAVRRVAGLVLPMALGLSISRLIPAIDRWVASGMTPGSISLLGYANRLLLVIQPVLTTGISISGFALMSGLVARGDSAGLKAAMEKSFRILLFFGVPAAVLLSAFSRPLIALLLERGAFPAEDAREAARLFSIYVLSLPVTAAGTVIAQGFYVLKDTRTPLAVGVVEVALYLALCLALSPLFGLTALPVSFFLYFHFSALVLALLLSRKVGFSVPALLGRPLATSLAASGAAWGAGLALRALLPESNAWAPVALAGAFAAYFAVQKYVFRSPEAGPALRLVLAKIQGTARRAP